ncbi:MAG: hypothetical protein ACREJ0_06120 [Geminicoccaceae bacterium]
MDSTLRDLAVDDLATTHAISASARRLADLVHEFSTACRLWLSEISEALSSGKLRPPAATRGKPDRACAAVHRDYGAIQ